MWQMSKIVCCTKPIDVELVLLFVQPFLTIHAGGYFTFMPIFSVNRKCYQIKP